MKTAAPRLLTHEGKTQALKDWSQETGISEWTIRDRIDKQGWDVGRALTVAPNSRKNAPVGAGRELKDGVMASFLRVWKKYGKEEFERQLVEAFKEDALKVMRDFRNFLPDDVKEQGSKAERATVRIEFTGAPPNNVTIGGK
jgi:hypothetical protein